MKPWFVGSLVISAALTFQTGVVQAESAQESFAIGKALVAKADFQGALRAFANAARMDQDKQEYLQHYAMVRQVIALRQRLDVERDDARWEYFARGLRSFYISNGLLNEALSLDERMHARLNTTTSAKLLAETQLALNMNEEAAKTLADLAPEKQTSDTRALQGLALARQGEVEQARQIVAAIDLAEDAGPGTIYSLARLKAAIGDTEQALALLARCFESLAPSRHEAFKDHARKSPEFAGLVSTETFVKVLQTESKVPESKCSGGSRCAGCPMRGQCSGSAGH
jgi:tetratricopeptide (TPR) repeat protein